MFERSVVLLEIKYAEFCGRQIQEHLLCLVHTKVPDLRRKTSVQHKPHCTDLSCSEPLLSVREWWEFPDAIRGAALRAVISKKTVSDSRVHCCSAVSAFFMSLCSLYMDYRGCHSKDFVWNYSIKIFAYEIVWKLFKICRRLWTDFI